MAGYATKHLARVIGLSAANYILLTADRIEPEQALKWGIVTEVLEPEALMPRAIEIAELIVENAPLSVEGTKAQIQEWRLAKVARGAAPRHLGKQGRARLRRTRRRARRPSPRSATPSGPAGSRPPVPPSGPLAPRERAGVKTLSDATPRSAMPRFGAARR